MTRVRCPNCQMWHTIEDTFENRIRRPFKADVAAPTFPATPATTYAPAGQPNRETHVAVPFDQAKITGFFAAPLGGVVAYGVIMIIDATPSIEVTSWGKVAVTLCGVIATGFCAAGWMWFRRLGVYDGLLWTVEEITGADLDGDGEVGQPPVNRVEVELRRNGKPWKFESLEISQDRLIKLARAVAGGGSFANRTALDCGIPREEFEALRNKFVSRAWAEWKGEPGTTQGVRLTDEGLDIIGEIATTPLPRAGRGAVDSMGRSRPLTPAQGNYERFEHIEP